MGALIFLVNSAVLHLKLVTNNNSDSSLVPFVWGLEMPRLDLLNTLLVWLKIGRFFATLLKLDTGIVAKNLIEK